jgi:hypothetical protein
MDPMSSGNDFGCWSNLIGVIAALDAAIQAAPLERLDGRVFARP